MATNEQITVYVECSNGNNWITRINGSFQTAHKYFMGRDFVTENRLGEEVHNIVNKVEQLN